MNRRASFISCLMIVAFATFPRLCAEPMEVRYSQHVRPILSNNCFACHGPDEESREAGLRLDQRESTMAELDSGMQAIVPGKPDESELVVRITSEDDYQMPPPESHKSLKTSEIATLIKWIKEGAHFEEHWSLVPPVKANLPAANDSEQEKSPIDAYVQARLNQKNLTPAPRADKRTLIRRLSLDLLGLPPSPEEVAAFVADDRDDAYERLVDRLLASPHYGERMAVDWLDAARYADTHGYHIDSHRDMWPWRDWVIDAFNDNMPFDQFTIWQLAGDLLPEATNDQLIASGFNRNHGINFEGGAIPEEYHVEYVVDRVNTLGTVWLGMTLGCARCHDHKYDAISQEEYFKLFAFFNTIDEKGLDGQRGNAEPKLQLPSDDQKERKEHLASWFKELERELDTLDDQLNKQQADWEKEIVDQDESEESHSIADTLWYGLPPLIEETAAEVLARNHLPSLVNIDVDEKLQIDGKQHEWVPMPAILDGNLHNFIFERSANYLWRSINVDSAQQVKVSVGCSDAISLWLNGKLIYSRDQSLPVPERQQQFDLQLKAGENHLVAKVVNISWECNFYFAMSGLPRPVPAEVLKIAKTPVADRSEEDAKKIRNYFRENVASDSTYQTLRSDVLEASRSLEQLNDAIPTTMVMREMTESRKTFRLDRGQYNSPQEEVLAATPALLPKLSGDCRTRLDLAEWLMSPSHPLPARVTVNRLWQQLFGIGLVSTAGDFGTQGEWPSHPELLDWLAVEFVESGWDVKHMLRLMVLTETYQQASNANPEKLQQDPYNRLLSRGPRFRLQAEFIRDLALNISGLLNEEIGGRSVKTYQPQGLWRELAHQKDNTKFTAQIFEQAGGNDLYRRSLYTFWKRSMPPPNMVAFDAPNRETCIVRRETTNTPLQALVLLNDPTFVEASRWLAARMIAEAPESDEAKAKLGFLLATARQPGNQELEILLRTFRNSLEEYRSDRQGAESLLSVGDSPRGEHIDPAEHAAWTSVAMLILNLDETITNE